MVALRWRRGRCGAVCSGPKRPDQKRVDGPGPRSVVEGESKKDEGLNEENLMSEVEGVWRRVILSGGERRRWQRSGVQAGQGCGDDGHRRDIVFRDGAEMLGRAQSRATGGVLTLG